MEQELSTKPYWALLEVWFEMSILYVATCERFYSVYVYMHIIYQINPFDPGDIF